jgi:hypothetical protein
MREYYMVRDDVWWPCVGGRSGMLCIGCLETRLGRELCAADFIDAYINSMHWGSKSMRLVDRLTRHGERPQISS